MGAILPIDGLVVLVHHIDDVIGTNGMNFHWPLNTDALQEALGVAVSNVLSDKQKPEDALRDAEKRYNNLRD